MYFLNTENKNSFQNNIIIFLLDLHNLLFQGFGYLDEIVVCKIICKRIEHKRTWIQEKIRSN